MDGQVRGIRANPASWGWAAPEWCASQYFPANPNDFSTWT